MDLLIQIDRSASESLVSQVYSGIRQAIEQETLGPGDRLPSTREFARQLGITRFTVDDAYARLVSEGYLEARHGSGTYVAEHVHMPQPASGSVPTPISTRRQLSTWASRLRPEPPSETSPNAVDFNFLSGTPALDQLPTAIWQRLIRREARDQAAADFTYGYTAGLPALREAIASWVARSRGVTCTADQVLVTSGAQQSMDLVMRMLLDPGSKVVVEDPCYRFVRRVASLTGASIIPIRVDGEGLDTDRLPESDPNIRLACITPSHQYPTGAILPLSRRLDLLAWAGRTGALIYEDDYDGELRYDSRPVPALAALATAGNGPNNVIYSGSFSKVLFPALRLGYIILPPDLVGPFSDAKATVDRHAPTLNQAVVAAFITEGHFERHLVRMRRLYSRRHDALISAMETHLAGIAFRDESMHSAGLHILTRFVVDMTETELEELAFAHGIGFEGAGKCYITPPTKPHIFMGYAALPEEDIHAGIARLGQILHS
jgi:GntR family transcriptional regulator/MocR family aminotransferase